MDPDLTHYATDNEARLDSNVDDKALVETTAFLSLVIIIKCVSSRDSLPRTNSPPTLPRGLKQPVHRVERENLNGRRKRGFDSLRKFPTHFEGDEKFQMVSYNGKQCDFNNKFQPQNSFKCPPCVCKNISSHLVTVFCERSNFTSIPQNWPVEIYGISIENFHRLKVLDSSHFLIYTSKNSCVKIAYGRLVKVLNSGRLKASSLITELDISYNKISTVEDTSFVLVPNLLELLLNYNSIRNLTRQMFTGLYSLRSLSVSHNYINFIANDTFDDLGTLVNLDISFNYMIYTGHDSLPARMFIPLNNLEQLYINGICDDGPHLCETYPNKALQVLTNLKLLSIDGADRRGLGPEIKSLIHLRHLIITYPETDNTTEESYFDNVPFIKTLHLSILKPYIDLKAFTNLKHLVNFTYVHFGPRVINICQVLSDIQCLLNSSLKYLTLRQINDRACGCKELRAEDAKYLAIFKLVELDLSKNYLGYLSPDFISMLPASLRKIDLSGNGLTYEIFNSFHKLPQDITELNLNDQYNAYYPCHDDGGISSRHVTKLLKGNKHPSNMSLISTLIGSGISFKHLKHKMNNENIETIEFSKDCLPPKLRILRGDNFRDLGNIMFTSFNILCNYSLKELSLVGGFEYCGAYILMPDVEIADFSNNYASDFYPHFFLQNSSLKYLSISNNLFGPDFQHDRESLIFENVKRLIALDMSRNFITELSNDFFKNLVKLEILDISKNQLQMINISFAHMTEIRILDFSTNSITSISKHSRNELDSIAAEHRVYLDLTSNPIPCTCEGLELLKWMALTNVYLLNHDFLVCRNDYDQVLDIGDLVQRVETLQRQCALKTVIILTCVFSFIVFGILLLTSLTYRYRWKLRYLRSIALVKLVGSRPEAVKIGYKFDAYILYSDDTRRFVVRDCVHELEVKRGHRLCIEERDFLPGTYNVSNIVSGVQNSARTVAMVTPEFYQGEYSEYGVKMALMEEIFMHRSVLFLCMYEQTDNTDLSHEFLTAMKQNKYIELPPIDDASDEMMDDFWNQFSRAIGSSIEEEL